jgi:hypothetical protein
MYNIGNANDNSVQSGEWKWLRVDLGRLTVADALSRLTRARLRPLKELEIIMEEHISRDKAVSLSEILARNGKKSSI